MTDPHVGTQPDPAPTPPEPEPGGADAIDYGTGRPAEGDPPAVVPHDPHPDLNPSTGDVPEVMKEGEDTSTRATEADDSGDTHGGTSEEESPA